jgi:tetratricopeptide (TPR) repeat protein
MSGYDRAFKPASAQDAERHARLTSLGYLSAAPAATGALADPKDRIGEYGAILRALSLAAKGMDAEAVSALEPLLRTNPGFVDLWYAYASSLSRLGRLDEAIEAGRTGLRTAPSDSPNLVHLVAELYLRKGNPDDAMKHALLARSMGETRVDLLLPEILLAQGDVPKAEQAAREAVARSSLQVNPRLILAHVLATKGDAVGALAELDEVGRLLAASHAKSPSSYHLFRGQVLAGLGRNAEAIAEIEEERRGSPGDLEAGLALARLYALAGRSRDARSVTVELLRKKYTDPVLLQRCLIALEAGGDAEGGTALRRRGQREFPGDVRFQLPGESR